MRNFHQGKGKWSESAFKKVTKFESKVHHHLTLDKLTSKWPDVKSTHLGISGASEKMKGPELRWRRQKGRTFGGEAPPKTDVRKDVPMTILRGSSNSSSLYY